MAKKFQARMRGIRLLSLLFLFLLTILGVAAWYSYDSPAELLAALAGGKLLLESILGKIRYYFSNAGSYNFLILLLVVAVLTVFFTLNDLFLERWFHSRKNKTFFRGGFAWLAQRSSALLLVLLEIVLLINLVVWLYARERIVRDAQQIKEPQTVLLLGTNKKLSSGEGMNLYYAQRIEAVAHLVKQGKVKRIIISGDNGKTGYNEPADMRYSLLKKGVPEHLIELDYAGFRTLDSIVRLKGHFGIQKALIVSQRFHIERALLLAWFYDVEAGGYAAEGSMTPAMAGRELLAKPKAFLDVFVFNMQPRYGKTYAKASVNWQNPKDRNFAGIVLAFCIFAGLMVYLFFHD